jgi:hypothetical protein
VEELNIAMGKRLVAKYKMWKQNLYKWDSYVYNRHLKEKKCDAWSRFIIENTVGKSVVFNSGGLFFKDFMPDITVVENHPCPVLNLPQVKFLTDGADFDAEFDNIIMVNPIALKYHHSIFDFLTVPGISRMGQKPNIIRWLKSPGKIYLSTSDWHIYWDRLKFSVHEMMGQQIRELRHHGIQCEYLEITPVNSDIENGNIKMILTVDNNTHC